MRNRKEGRKKRTRETPRKKGKRAGEAQKRLKRNKGNTEE